MGAPKIMTSTPLTRSDPGPEPRVSVQQIEAARYAVLRRLAPSLRHHMVRPLQPIGLIYGVLHHKLSADAPDLQAVRLEAGKINEFSKAALSECSNIGTWMAPEAGDLIDLASGVRESVGLLATMLHFCGFRLVNEVDDLPAQVQQDAVRMLLNAVLLEVTDGLNEPAILTLSATVHEDTAVVVLQVSPNGEGGVDRYDDSYRKLVWADVQALAFAEQVGLARDGHRTTLTFPLAETATAP